MVIKTYLDKVNTIIEESSVNTGLNPISEIAYGVINTRMLLHFNTENVRQYLCKNGVKDYSQIKHFLKLTNCGFINSDFLHKKTSSQWGEGEKMRASSFDLIFFLIPQEWDEGKGFDYNFCLQKDEGNYQQFEC